MYSIEAHGTASTEIILMIFSVIVALIGIGVATMMYLKNPDMPAKFTAKFAKLHRWVFNKWYVDEAYDILFINCGADDSDAYDATAIANLRDFIAAGGSDDVRHAVSTLAALAGSHAASRQELDLVGIAVSRCNRCTHLSGADLFAATDNALIIGYFQQFAGQAKVGLEERADVQIVSQPASIIGRLPIALFAVDG